MKFIKLALVIVVLISFNSCYKNLNSLGDHSVTVFENTNLYFDLAFSSNSEQLKDSILRLDAGRVILKKVKLPNYELQPKTTVNVTLTSNGDPWDKSGSLFVIPKSASVSLLDFETKKFDLSTLNQDYAAVVPFEQDALSYQPNIELLRFMTPFGVGYFNDNEYTKDRKPIYIPHWENEVNWTQDITHLLPLLEDEVYIGVYIDTWTKEGYNISVSLDFDESNITNHKKEKVSILPLVNTVKYAAAQRLYDGFAKQSLTYQFETTTLKNAKLYYTTTGHGGHSGGDEFVKKENVIVLDNEIIKQFIPWRDDCASFRRFNPSSGVWKRTTQWKGEEIDERLASSDLSRSNWCPGSKVTPEVIELGDLSAGTHFLKIGIPEAQVAANNENNYWMVSAYIVYDK